MGRRRGAGDAALDLRRGDARGQGRERLRRVVAGLHLHRAPVDGGAVEARRRAGLEPPQREAERLERRRQPERRRLPGPAGRPVPLAEMDQPAQEGAGGDDHRPCPQLTPVRQPDPGEPAVGLLQGIGLTLDHRQIRGRADRRLHRGRIKLAVGLGAWSAHRRPLAPVEHAELDAALVDHPAHQPVERIDLADQVAFAEPADRRVARHRTDSIEAMGHQRRARAHARGGRRGLAAGVPAPNHDDVE